MTFNVSPAAREEAAGTARYYQSRPGQYGAAFLAEFDAALAAIEADPRRYPLADDGRDGCEDRLFYLARFQQKVYFTIKPDGTTVVLAVVHASQRPGRWYLKPRDED